MKLKMIPFVCILVLAALLAGCAAPASTPAPTTAPAPTAEEQALAAYREILEAAPAIAGDPDELQDASFDEAQNLERFGKHYDFFAVTDLDQDGTPELIALTAINFRWSNVSVFTYADGKAQLLKDPQIPADGFSFAQQSTAGGAYTTCTCAEHHLHSIWQGSTPVGDMEEDTAYSLSGAGLTVVNCSAADSRTPLPFLANTPENTSGLKVS